MKDADGQGDKGKKAQGKKHYCAQQFNICCMPTACEKLPAARVGPMVQTPSFHTTGARLQSLVGELRSFMPHIMAKKCNKQNNNEEKEEMANS